MTIDLYQAIVNTLYTLFTGGILYFTYITVAQYNKKISPPRNYIVVSTEDMSRYLAINIVNDTKLPIMIQSCSLTISDITLGLLTQLIPQMPIIIQPNNSTLFSQPLDNIINTLKQNMKLVTYWKLNPNKIYIEINTSTYTIKSKIDKSIYNEVIK